MLKYHETVLECYNNDEFLAEFNRLTGYQLKMNKTPIEFLIDEATGVVDEQLREFFAFVYEYVYNKFLSTHKKLITLLTGEKINDTNE
ncbi:MAG: hypothetical protein LBV67_12565 [Streptococcaceae bacterium]|jgi:hypothetical protein|nr:hypothetical protein [Streptococcaceae bacterium]